MIKSSLAALVIGLAIGLGLVGFGVDAIDGSRAESEPTFPEATKAPEASQVVRGSLRTAASHVYEGLNARLNPNVINGVQTVLCTTDARVFALLDEAVNAWNLALSDLAFGGDGAEVPLHLHKTSSGAIPTGASACADMTVTGGVDVVVVVGDCESNPIACYRRETDPDTGRMSFTVEDDTDDGTDPYANSEHATIIYETDNISGISAAVLIHELGHVLGLRDYQDEDNTAHVDEGCASLRDGAAAETDPPEHIVDPLGNHYSLMRNLARAECSTVGDGGAITARDLLDFYEAYRVGAITNVQVALAEGQSLLRGGQPFTFKWGTDGIEEASHGASHVVAFGKDEDDESWCVVGHMPVQDARGNPQQSIDVANVGCTFSDAFADLYKVVGVTRGDIRRNGADFDLSSTLRLAGPGSGTITARFVEGDPTFVAGVSLAFAAANPNILSASVSPRYCYTDGGGLTVGATVNNDRDGRSRAIGTISVAGPDSQTRTLTTAERTGEVEALCGSAAGERTITVSVTWGSGDNSVRRTISLPVKVYPSPTSVSATVESVAGGCTAGEAAFLLWSASGGFPPYEIWIDGAGSRYGRAEIECPATTGATLRGLALDAHGAGTRLTSPAITVRSTAPATPCPQTRSRPSGLDHLENADGSVTFSWSADASTCTAGYQVQLGDDSATRRAVLTGTKFSAGMLPVDAPLDVRVRTSYGTGDPSPWAEYRALRTPVLHGSPSVRNRTATVSWNAVAGASSYQVKWDNQTDDQAMTVASSGAKVVSHEFTRLNPRSRHQLYIRARGNLSDLQGEAAGAVAQTVYSKWLNVEVDTDPDPLTLTASATPTTCETGGTVSINWSVSGGTPTYRVRINGVEDASSPAHVTCQSTAGRQRVSVFAHDSGNPQLSRSTTVWFTVTAPPDPDPLVLTASAKPTTCETGGTVSVSWSVSGGTIPYTVTVDDVTDQASPYSVTCQSTAGTQTVSVVAKDSGAPKLSKSKTVQLTVTAPPSATHSFEGRARARIRATGRVEYCFQLRNQDCIMPRSRFLTPSAMTAGKWYHTSSVIDGGRTLGKISVMKPSGATYIDVCFTPQGGSRACPTPNNFSWGSATVDSWRSAAWKTYKITSGVLGSSDAPDPGSAMQPANANEPAGDDLDGGSMQDDEQPAES